MTSADRSDAQNCSDRKSCVMYKAVWFEAFLSVYTLLAMKNLVI